MVLLSSTPFAPGNHSEASYSIREAMGSFLPRLRTSRNLGEASGNLWAPLETSSKFLEFPEQMAVFGKRRGKNEIHSSMVV